MKKDFFGCRLWIFVSDIVSEAAFLGHFGSCYLA